MNGVHDLLDVLHSLLRQVGNLHTTSGILSAFNLGPLVEQVEQFSAIDLVKGNRKFEALVLLEQLDDVVRGQGVHSADRAVRRAHHRERLARSSLPVRETCGFGSRERLSNQWLYALLIERLVVSSMLEDIVESEVVLLDVLGEIDLLPAQISIYDRIKEIIRFIE